MNSLVSTVITALGYLTILGQVLTVILFLVLIIRPFAKSKFYEYYFLFKTNALTFAFIVASSATLGSLFLSEIAGFDPCKLCWYQRAFMYPLSVILLVSLVKNDKGVVKYVLPLSVIGGAIAVYHYVMQLFPTVLSCSEEVAKCSTIQFASFGYITIPLMSATAFALIILSSLIYIKKK